MNDVCPYDMMEYCEIPVPCRKCQEDEVEWKKKWLKWMEQAEEGKIWQ